MALTVRRGGSFFIGKSLTSCGKSSDAVRVVTESHQASISWLQRKLRVGYNRAARMIERMEREGVVSQAEGARPREVLARRLDGNV